MNRILCAALILPLAACNLAREQEPALAIEVVTAGGPVAVSADPTVSAASLPQNEGRFLGFSVTTLADASLPGLWLDTPLVRTEMTGRVVAENGRQINLLLRPTGGARGSGSRMSLAGFNALGIPLTAITTLTVIGDV